MSVSSISQNLIVLIKDTLRKLALQLGQLHLSKPGFFELALAIGVFIFVLVYSLQRAGQPFFHDSFNYWNLSDSFLKDGNFSFTNYSNGLRGYFFPFILFLIKSLGNVLKTDAKQLFHIFSALYFTVLAIYILPGAFHSIFRWRIHLWGRVTIALLLFFFWRGHFLYPLTDFPAFTALLISIWFLSHSLRFQTSPVWAFLIGFFVSVAVNIRPAYQLSLIMLILFFLFQLYRLKTIKALQGILFFLLGCAFVLVPQYLINQTHFNTNSPLVLARVAEDENLYTKQLFWGLETQKIEANIGNNDLPALMIFEDPFILNLQKTNLLREKTFAGYIKIMQRFPLEIAVSYFRHLFNGLDLFFPTPYVKNVSANHAFLSFTNYLIWFLVVLHLLKTDLSRIEYISAFATLVLLAPVALAIPTVIEVRFFLPAYLLAYGVVAFGLDYLALAKSFLKDKWEILRFVAVFTLWIILCFTLSNTTIEHLVR